MPEIAHPIPTKRSKRIKYRWGFRGNTLTINSLPKYWEPKIGRKRIAIPDAAEVVLHAPFQALVNFVDIEQAGLRIDWNTTEHHKQAWNDIMECYAYWTRTRKFLEREKNRVLMGWSKTFRTRCEDDLKGPKHKNGSPMFSKFITVYKNKKEYNRLWKLLHKKEAEFDKLEDTMLVKLCNVRRYLWV